MKISAPGPPRAASSLRVLFVDNHVAIGEIGPACVVIWREAVSARRVEQLAKGLAQVVEQHSTGAGLFVVSEASSAPPDDPQRRALIAMVASHGDKVKCIAMTIEATGFHSAVIRSVLSGMALLDRRPDEPPRGFFANVGAAAAFARAYLALQDDFLARVEELRLLLGRAAH